MKKMTLREVCEQVGVTRRAVQGYEKIGLVAPTGRNKYGYLLYDCEAVEKIEKIKMYQDFGFQLKQIAALFQASKEEYALKMEQRLEEMREELKKLEANIQKLEEILMM